MKISSRTILALFALAIATSPADACFMRSPMPVQVFLDHIHIDITNQVAVKTYNCTFKNTNSRAVVGGTCYMELEPGAQIDNMSVFVDGKEMKAEILDVEKAKKVFTDIVKNGGSPALLEYFGNQLIQTHVPRIAANGTVTVKLTYTMVLKSQGGLIRLQMLNTNPKALLQPLKSASVSININSKTPIKNVYSPTHEINIEEKKGWDVSINWKQENYLPKHPFVLYYQTDEKDVAASLVAHRELDEQGHFMLMLSPTIGQGAGKVGDAQILPKDIVFCVDTSGSMLKGNKMQQAQKALEYCVSTLRKGDRFNIVDFSTVARNFHENGLVEFNDQSKAKALRYVNKLHARGGTAIHEALELSLKHLGKKGTGRLKMIIFATDGLPTIGERDPAAILKSIAKKNTEDVRLFVFGEGFDVNTKLLDFLALNHRGEADYILPTEDITQKISRFFDRVGSPIMTDLKIEFEGLEVKDVFPRKISDVFKGEQVIIYGRYTGHGEKTIKLTGTFQGKTQTIRYKLNFPEYSEDDKSSFVPRLWAGRKVDYLLNEIRQSEKTPSKELVDEITYLAKRHGIITPYTSFLVTDDIAGKTTPGPGGRPIPIAKPGLFRQRFAGRLKKAAAPTASEGAKRDRVKDAKAFAKSRRNIAGGKLGSYADAADEYLKRAGKGGSSLTRIRYIGSRTLYKRGTTWVDGEYESDKKTKPEKVTTVEIGSTKYFELLSKNTRVAKYLALGDVILPIKGQWYFFVPKKVTKK